MSRMGNRALTREPELATGEITEGHREVLGTWKIT